MKSAFPALIAACALLLAASPSSAGARADGPWVDVSAYVTTDEQINGWYGMTWQLGRDFDATCGDTFCEGEYTNIQALRYQCSVHRVSGRIGMCVWSFAASNEVVDPASGKVAVQSRFWQCRTPLAPGTTLEQVLAAVVDSEPLYAVLPGGRSIFDGLVDCL